MRNEAPVFSIVDVLAYYGGDAPSSGRAWAPVRCPFHGDDRNPSASVNVEANRFICHVCMDRSEDAIGLVMWHEQRSFKDAVALIESFTSPLNDPVRGSTARRSGLSSLLE